MIRKDTDSLISFKFFSLADFYKSVSEKIGSTPLSTVQESETLSGERTRFNGANHSQIQQRKYSWPEGVKMLRTLANVDIQITKQWTKKWSEDDGDEMDMERYFNDMPFLQKRVKEVGIRSRNNTIQKILINITENADVQSEELLWKTYTATKICDELESRGIRCEIVLFETGKNVDNYGRNSIVEIPVKQSDEPINISLLCTVFSPWFFRYWIFHLLKSHIENVRSSLGAARKLTTNDIPDLENCIVIDSGTALSKEAANNFLKGVKV